MDTIVRIQPYGKRSNLLEVEASKLAKSTGVLDSTASIFANLATKRSSIVDAYIQLSTRFLILLKDHSMLFNKDCGILLHPSSLPSPYGIGEIGKQALKWIDQLAAMGQNLWQILPLGPTGYGESPYQSHSSFAGNTLLVSIEDLIEQGWLSSAELGELPSFAVTSCDYNQVIPFRRRVLATAAKNFLARHNEAELNNFQAFCSLQSEWLEDFSLYMAIKQSHDLISWTDWPENLRSREPQALAAARENLAQAIQIEKVLQYFFDCQWQMVRKHARANNIKIIGDIPIFVAHDSADVWAVPELFKLDQKGQPTVIAGVPPDYFSSTGQRWGNPHYDWPKHVANGFKWWLRRVARCLDWSDIVRIDHFRGFEAAWEIPASESTAINGQWVKAPGRELFFAIQEKFGAAPIIAEDLGLITPEVQALRDDFNLPGLRILQFAFGNDDQANSFHPSQYIENCVAYTGVHDNDTVVGWFNSQAGTASTRSQEDIDLERQRVLNFLGTDGKEIHWDFIKVLLQSKAGAVLYQLQDVLGLGSTARMNIPSTMGNNWRWRFTWEQLTPNIIKQLANYTNTTGRGSFKF